MSQLLIGLLLGKQRILEGLKMFKGGMIDVIIKILNVVKVKRILIKLMEK
jgi:hypothetical protein